MVHKKRMIFIWEKLVPTTYYPPYAYWSSMDGEFLEIEELENLEKC
jgi:hypothetical protein